MLIGRRFGRPGLIGTVARTAVITGTAAMTAGAVAHHQQKKYDSQDEAAAFEGAQQQAAVDAQVQASVAAQSPVPAPADPLIIEIKQLAALHASGVLTDQEFAEAKAKLLAG